MSDISEQPDVQAEIGPERIPHLGKRLRERRKARGLTLQAVADAAGLTAGFISQVERGIAAPSLASLTAISRVLGTDPGELFAQPPSPGTMTRHGARPVYGIDPGHMTYERISSAFPGNQIRAVLIHDAPGHQTEAISHEGEELYFILSGALTLELEGQVHLLEAGDSIHFASSRVHSTWNHTKATTTHPARRHDGRLWRPCSGRDLPVAPRGTWQSQRGH